MPVQEKSYYALAAFCEKIVCHWFSCISSKRSIAFFPYKQPVLKLMKNFVVLSNGEDLCSRERAIELVGIVAMFAGRTRMGSILPPFIEAAISVYWMKRQLPLKPLVYLRYRERNFMHCIPFSTTITQWRI
ncbi:unnamed protein product [Cuscuta epithymum]|uniref:Uncharacterized protein n=1 Tax=Cuscuta epithymum TaxID=186058 RepID=A0AAV0E8I6_9ASTE|nr:unnamed protein product [Cuscuta epithymum]